MKWYFAWCARALFLKIIVLFKVKKFPWPGLTVPIYLPTCLRQKKQIVVYQVAAKLRKMISSHMCHNLCHFCSFNFVSICWCKLHSWSKHQSLHLLLKTCNLSLSSEIFGKCLENILKRLSGLQTSWKNLWKSLENCLKCCKKFRSQHYLVTWRYEIFLLMLKNICQLHSKKNFISRSSCVMSSIFWPDGCPGFNNFLSFKTGNRIQVDTKTRM